MFKLFQIMTACLLAGTCLGQVSKLETTQTKPITTDTSTLTVNVIDDTTSKALPVRAIVTDAAGEFVDGSGRGTYRDGRFFAEGKFEVSLPAGSTRVQLWCGANYSPIDTKIDLVSGKHVTVTATMHRWFSPETRGWYAGDNHVHAQHDSHAVVKTDLSYTALQGRANGLSFLTEAGSNTSYDALEKLSTDHFLIRFAPEIRPGAYVGHFNTPGIREPIGYSELEAMTKRPLPAHAVYKAVRERGGIVIHTHPMTPRHQLHWMGASQAYSDAVLGNCVNLFDVDAKHTQQLWFSMLNLGNRVGVSSYTDSALGRTSTLSPGDRRVYCQTDSFSYDAIVDAMRNGRTMATNGGPIFVFMKVNGQSVGSEFHLKADDQFAFEVEAHSLHAVRSLELYLNGDRVRAFNVNGRSGKLAFADNIDIPTDRPSWLVARTENMDGKWCLTSPIYFTPNGMDRSVRRKSANAILFEISNASRFAQLRPDFFAHALVTVSPNDQLTEVTLIKDGKPLRLFRSSDGNQFHKGKVPVNELHGEYGPGWAWHPNTESPSHFQCDWPITKSGWYAVQAKTKRGLTLSSDAMLFDATNPNSHATSIAHLRGMDTSFTLWGHGEDVELKALRHPFMQGGWWYPKNGSWRLVTKFVDRQESMGWPPKEDTSRFRRQ